MGSEQVQDFLFVGLSVLPTGLFATGYPAVALLVLFPLLISACLSGSGPCQPQQDPDHAGSDLDSTNN